MVNSGLTVLVFRSRPCVFVVRTFPILFKINLPHTVKSWKMSAPREAGRPDEVPVFQPIRMPWIHLIDPITGELPKNYEQILAKEKEAKKANSVQTLELKRLPRSYFLDPDAGKPISFNKQVSVVTKSHGVSKYSNRCSHLFSNSKLATAKSANQLKSQKSSGSNKLTRPSTSSVGNGNTKQRKKSSDFEVSKSNSDTVSTITGRQTMHTKVLDNGVRKKLFMEAPKPRKNRVPMIKKPEPVVKNQRCVIDIISASPPNNDYTVALLEMSVTESELINNGHKLTSETLEPFTLGQDLNSPKNECSSGSSISEFLQYEQLCRTPKQKKSSTEIACFCDRSDYYIEKISNITEKLSELLEESKDVLEHLKNCKKMNGKGSNKKRRSRDNKENVPSNSTKSILTSTKKKAKDLRVDTLKKNVTFNVLNKRDKVEKALNLYNSVRATNTILGTPKVLNNANSDSPSQQIEDSLSKRVQDQCLLLQQTPK